MSTDQRCTRSQRNTRRAEIARERRRRRACILAGRRSRRTLQNETRTQNTNNMERDLRSNNLDSDSESETDVVVQHFNRMRNRIPRRPDPRDVAAANSMEGSEERLGVQAFNSTNFEYPLEAYELKYPCLLHESNYTCQHCGSVLWKEERSGSYNCCNRGRSAIHRLKPIPQTLLSLFQTARFRESQRAYNGLFSFTALGAGGIENRSWTQGKPPTMLTLHGKAYHRIFDLQEKYQNQNVNNSARFYIFDSEFAQTTSSQHLDSRIAGTLRSHVNSEIRWAREYRSAVDTILNTSASESSAPFIEFSEVSRVNDGPVLGENPSANEIAALVFTSGNQNDAPRAVITYPRNSPDNKPRFLPLWSSAYETLQFPLLFLHGEAGWSKGNYKENPPFKSKTMNRSNTEAVTFPFYCRQRILSEPIFKINCRIAQEWVCDSLSRMEEERLNFVENSDMQHRLASNRSIQDAQPHEQPGKLLPASHPGSPAKRKSDTEDALCIVNRRGRPHLFITVTFNADWKEVQENLLPGQSAYDRPDLCCRVFKLKMKEIMKVLKSGKIFGAYDSHLAVTEFQKRGYPHAHILMTFKNAGPDALNEMDKWVWAQLPDENIAGGKLREKVLKYMIHKPCGAVGNMSAPCMQVNRHTNKKCCNKYFPQPFRSIATVNDKTGRAEYTRRKNGDNPTIRMRVNNQWKSVRIGNEWVVPYNPMLLMMFDCHICVDVVTATSCVKYVFKYCHKGDAFIRARIQGITSEVEQYRKTRYISAAEATWRLLGYHMVDRYPAVTKIHAHLEGEQQITYPKNATHDDRLEIAAQSQTHVLRYYMRPKNPCFSDLTILDYYEQYTITSPKKDDPPLEFAPLGKYLDGYKNIVSKRKNDDHVCRISFQSPAVGDLYYLRLLLHTIPARSFAELRTVQTDTGDPVVHPTFHDAARARGLITGDEEYSLCMEEASVFQVASQLRALFVTLILDGAPAPKLWRDFKDNLIEDFLLRLSTDDAIQAALCEIDLKLNQHGKCNEQVNLPKPMHPRTEFERMRDAFDPQTCAEYAELHEPRLTSEQSHIYKTVLDSVRADNGCPFMIDAPAGTGKTYTEKCISARLRGERKTVLIGASTGIAALQLPGGWTAHSMFKLPMDEAMSPTCVCNINTNTQRAELIRKADLIIWDELPMTHRYCIEALDRTLQDLMKNNKLFGGKTILFSGDWRQTGPIVKNGTATDTVDAAFISSPLWKHVKRMRLTKSQRDKDDPQYAAFVRAIGEGTHPTQSIDGTDMIALNNHNLDANDHFQLKYTTNFDELMNFVYPNVNEQSRNWDKRAILATTNNAIDRSNEAISDLRPGEYCTYLSSDTLISDETTPHTAFASPEHLHQLNVQGVPPHELCLKSDGLAMIVRNLNFSEGLVNGQKCVVLAVSPNSRVLQVELLTETSPHPIVLIPRIGFRATVGRNGITFMRTQFPIRTSYSVTVNRSQGQTLTKIGLDLRSPAFGHGQLYVALSRAQNRQSIMCLLPQEHIVDGIPHTENIVYPPFTAAATGQAVTPPPYQPPNTSPPAPSNASSQPSSDSQTPPPTWTVVDEIGDGACGFRGIARRIYNDPNRHYQVRSEILQYMNENRNDPNLLNAISAGMNHELLQALGEPPQQYTSYDNYLSIMSHPRAYLGEPEIYACMQRYNIPINVTIGNNPRPNPQNADPSTIHLHYQPQSRHYSSLILNNPSTDHPPVAA